jgi:hemerythrin-like domain-containing protein
MKRHDALIPLTHDHHHALARARRMRLAAAGDDLDEQRSASDEFLEFFDEHTLLHFREEEEILFPLVVDRPDAPMELLSRLLVEHVRLHGLVRDLRAQRGADGSPTATMAEIARLLADHIRAEESELFPLMERMLSEDELSSVHLAPRDRQPTPRPGA